MSYKSKNIKRNNKVQKKRNKSYKPKETIIEKKETNFKKTNNQKLNGALDHALKMTGQTISNEQRILLMQIINFFIVGVIATIIDWTIYFILYKFVNINPLIGNIVAFSVSIIYNYWASCKYVFKVNKNKSKERRFIEFVVFAIIGFGINELLIFIFYQKIGWNAMLVKIMATAIVMVFNFITRKMFLEEKK